MGEQTANLTALMEKLLSRFDEEQALATKRAEAQATFNTHVSTELQSLSKQLGLTQADVDDVRKATSPTASSATASASQVDDPSTAGSRTPAPTNGLQQPAPPPEQRAAPHPSVLPIPQVLTGAVQAARLANEGPPLLPVPGARPALPERAPPPTQREEYAPRPPKHQFPRFEGEAPRVWLDRCLAYFELYQVPLHNWVATAALYVDGHAALWLRAFRQTHVDITWEQFRHAVVEEFGPEEFESTMHNLLQLRQTGTVAEYRQQFEVHMYNLLALDPSLSTKFFVTQFLLGLKDELRAAVRLQAPNSITRATVFARIQEEELDIQRPRLRSMSTGRSPPLPGVCPSMARPPPAPVLPPAPAPTQRVAPAPKPAADDFGRERQLRDFRRQHGLCFRCGDKYSRDHQCKRSAQLLTIEVGDHGEVLSDEAVHALQLLDEPEGNIDATCCLLSAHAVEGTETAETIRLRASVGNQTMLLLVDSGSTHSFVNSSFAARIGAPTISIAPLAVRVANGQKLRCTAMVQQLQWNVQNHQFTTDMRVLDLGVYDAVLGVDWLAKNSPMKCDWQLKTIEFDKDSKTVHLTGVRSDEQATLTAMDAAELWAMQEANEIWGAALLEIQLTPTHADSDEPIPPTIQRLLTEFSDIFEEPTELPPHRQYDHAITLEPGAAPVNCRPYRYSPLQKDEIERQVSEMLKTGVITHSMSPFAAPVLLVKKKDGTWRFCVDYRRLNQVTIKNKFPLPIIDELLDELAGAAFFSKIDLRAGYHQIRMREGDEEKTAFKTHHGHFQFRVMPFGVTNGPPTFQCVMNSVFSGPNRKYVVIFLDDILVFSHSLEEHEEHLRTVFSILRQNQLYAKQSKCSFAQPSVEYLGHVISSEGVATDATKTSAMQAWPTPMNASELRGFLGLTGYYRKFVPLYGILAKPLTQLLTKKGFCWSEQAQTAFDLLKKAMMNTPVLALPDFSRPFSIETDACDTGVGAVLVQDGHPVAYLSKALGVKNQRLSIYEKEFLAVMMAVDKWRAYLQSAPFVIVTDHKSLCHLGDQQLETELQRKAMSKMVGLQFSFKYRRGSDNGAADALSRVGHLLSIDALSVCQPQWLQEVANSYETDADSQDLLQQLALCSPDEQGYELRQGVIRLQNRLWIGANTALQTKLISAFHASAVGGHSGVTATYQRLKKLFAWRGMKQAVEDFVHQCATCQHAKHEHLKTPGLLQPLPIPTEPWRDLTMDFVEGLPASDGYEVIMVVVDRFTKYAHFVPLRHPFSAATVAQAFWDNIIKLHGVPHSIVSDRDRVFTSAMWRALLAAAGTKLSYSTAYHPQTDGQSERVNQCLEMYLRCAVHDNPKQWRKWLPTAEFWYNTTHHSSLDTSPFKALYGQEPNLGGLPNISDKLPDTKDADLEWAQHNDRLRAQLARAQNRCKQKADRHRTEREFAVGDQVLLKLQPYAQSTVANRPCPKLAYKFFGPFSVEQRIGTMAYKLALPSDSRIHNVFHVSQLKPFNQDYTPVFSDLPKTPDLTAAPLMPEAILERRMVKKGSASIVQVRVRWSSLTEASATWEDYTVLRQRYPMAPIWEDDARAQAGAIVTPATA